MKRIEVLLKRGPIHIAGLLYQSLRKVVVLRGVLMIFVSLLSLLLSIQTIDAQNPARLRSVLSTGGSSKTVALRGRNFYYQQSIGQPGVTGPARYNNILIRQGFIQPLEGSLAVNLIEALPATVSPDPFSSKIIVSFSEGISDILFVTIYDLNGKIVYFNKIGAARELTLDVSFLPPALYILRVSTASKSFYTKMIKLRE